MTAYFPITLLSSLLLSLGYAGAASYSYTTIAFPGAAATNPVSINGSGLVAGYFFDSGFGGHGFTYEAGVYTQVDAGGTCGSTFVTGVNDAGLLSGYCFPSQGGVISFIDSNGTCTFFHLKSILDTYDEAVNNHDISVGYYFTNANTIESFAALKGKPYEVFAFPGSPATAAYGINNSDVIVGNAIPGNGGFQQGFVLRNGSYTFYQYPSAYETFFNGINDMGEIVGDQIPVARGDAAAFVLQYGSYTSLAVPGSVISIANGVNNQGVIVGSYTTGSIDLYTFGFIATPE